MSHTRLTLAALCLALLPLAIPARAQVAAPPSIINFQGRLATPDGNPVPDGQYSVRFSLWDAVTTGTEKWNKTLATVNVKNGVFAVALDTFPAGTFDGNLWLELKIGTDVPLSPRQQLVSVPYALKSNIALTVPDASITSAKLASGLLDFSTLGGSLALSQIPDGLITAPKLAPNILNNLGWGLFGNNGTDSTTNFIGTTDAAPLILKANNARALRLEYAQSGSNTSINVIGGYNLNSVDGGVVGATIAGGGGINSNVVTRNQIQGNFGTIGGGVNNLVSAIYGTIPGGRGNQVTASNSFAAGSYAVAAHPGSFVWADDNTQSNAPFTTASPRTFIVQAARGVGINKNNPASGTALDVNGKAVFTQVGIGTSTSGDALAVSGDASVTGGGNIGGNLSVTGQSQFKDLTAFGTTATPDPATPITVQANASQNMMLFTNAAGTDYRWRFNLLTDGVGDAFTLFESGLTNRITVRPGGNVGIGITTPTSLLHVAGTSNLAGNTTIGGNASLSGTLTVTGATTLSSTLGVTGNANFGALATSGNASVGGTLAVTGTSTLTGTTRLRANSSIGSVITPDATAPLGIQASPTNDLMVFANTAGNAYRWRLKLNTDGSSDAFTLFESGASNRITVRPGGNVGIGTDTPAAKLAVNGTTQLDGTTTVSGLLNATSTSVFNGNTAFGTVLTPDPNTPIAVQASATNDLMVFTNPSGANYRWRFKLNPDAGTDGFALFESGANNRITVRPGGNVGIGTNAPSEKLQVAGNVLANNVSVPSDARFKQHIQTLPDALETLLNLRGVNYEYDLAAFPDMNFNPGKQIGFIAQEVEKVLPELVHTDKNGYKSVTYTNIVPVLVEAVKQQQKQIDALSVIQKENAELKARLERLEAMLQRTQK